MVLIADAVQGKGHLKTEGTQRKGLTVETLLPRASSSQLLRCSPCQIQALTHIHRRADRQRQRARDQLAGLIKEAKLSEEALLTAINGLRRHAKVVLHFHPDRITNNGETVARRMLADGVYRNQFETGISNGSPTAFPGGDRDAWERELFGGAFHVQGVRAHHRPKYGSLQLFPFSDGPSPRFGSCYFVLHQDTLHRSTFTYGDSHLKPDTVGTFDALEPVMAALLHDVHDDGRALGVGGLTIAGVLSHLAKEQPCDVVDPEHQPVGRVLDDYIEVQVHGPIELEKDVERLVVDPAFRPTETGRLLKAVCDRYGIVLQWHRGFILPVQSVPADFRGPTMIPLSRAIADLAGTDYIDASAIGVAAASFHQNPDAWKAWGAPTEVLRRFRQMWHVIVRFGELKESPGLPANG